MNLIKKLLPLSIVGLALAPAAHAVIRSSGAAIFSNPVTTLTYTGNHFTSVTGVYSTSDYVFASFVFDGVLPQNADFQLLTLSSFSITDQHQTLTQANAGSGSLRVSTDSAANIVGWSFTFLPDPSIGFISSLWNPTLPQGHDQGVLMSDVFGLNVDTPGQWQVSVDNGSIDPAVAIEELIAAVQACVANGDLKTSHGQALINKLESALKKLEKDDIAAVAEKLNAFIDQVTELAADGQIATDKANALIADAQAILDAVQGPGKSSPAALHPTVEAGTWSTVKSLYR